MRSQHCATIAAALWLAGCGGGTALMHPAHTLPASDTRMGAGVQGNFVLGDARDRISAARSAYASGNAIDSTEGQAYAEGAIANVLMAPGISPFVGARVGLGYDTEAGLTYSGRAARVDARHSFESGSIAASAGLGLNAVLSRRGDAPDDPVARDSAVPGIDTSGISGWGADVPVIVGWRSDAELIQVWGGARGGYERVTGDVRLRVSPDATQDEVTALDARRYWLGGLVGFMVSIEPLWVGVELGVTYTAGEGSLERVTLAATAPGTYDAEFGGVALSPAAAVGGRF